MKQPRIYQLVGFCLSLLLVRFIKTDQYSFFFLLWNLFLAWLPLLIIRQYKVSQPVLRRWSTIGTCLLFLPNAPYIITDLFHLRKHLLAPLWFDTLLVFSFAFIGLFLFLRTLEELLSVLRPMVSSPVRFLILKAIILLSNGYGIYLGRYLRFNSWDLISNPFDLISSLGRSLFHEDHYRETLAISVAFSVFLYIIFELYMDLKKPAKHSLS